MLFLTYKAQRLNNNNKTNNFKLIAQAGKDSLTLNSCSLSFPVTEQGSEKKLEFQLALQTSSSQILLAPGKSYIYFFFSYLVCRQLAWSLPIGQVRMKFYLPGRKIYLSWMTRQHFFQALIEMCEIHKNCHVDTSNSTA